MKQGKPAERLGRKAWEAKAGVVRQASPAATDSILKSLEEGENE